MKTECNTCEKSWTTPTNLRDTFNNYVKRVGTSVIFYPPLRPNNSNVISLGPFSCSGYTIILYISYIFLISLLIPPNASSASELQNCTTLTITNYSQHPLRIWGSQCPGNIDAKSEAYEDETISLKATPNSELFLYNNFASNIIFSTDGSASQLIKVSEDNLPLRIKGVLGNEKLGNITVHDGWQTK